MNEVKGNQMHSDYAMTSYNFKKLFADTPYKLDSNGNFDQVVTGTQRDVVDYYHRFYKPANGQAFCYGPKSFVNECLDTLNNVLKDFEHDKSIREASKVSWQELNVIKSSKSKVPYPSYQDIDDYRLAQTWVLNDEHMDSRIEVMWFLLDELLMGTPEGTVAKVIANLNLGDDVFGGLEYSLQQWTFSIGVSGVNNENDVERTRQAITDKLNSIVSEGFSEDHLSAAMNKVAFKVSRKTQDSFVLCQYFLWFPHNVNAP